MGRWERRACGPPRGCSAASDAACKALLWRPGLRTRWAGGRARHREWAWPIRHARWERRACGPPRRSSASSAACTQSRARSHLSTSLAPVRRAWAQFDGSARVDRATAHWWRAATGVRCARRLRSDCGACATHLGPGHAAPPAVRSVWPCWQVAF